MMTFFHENQKHNFCSKNRSYGIFVAKNYDYALIDSFWGSAGFLDSLTSYATLGYTSTYFWRKLLLCFKQEIWRVATSCPNEHMRCYIVITWHLFMTNMTNIQNKQNIFLGKKYVFHLQIFSSFSFSSAKKLLPF